MSDDSDIVIKKIPSQADLIDAACEVQPLLRRGALLGGLAMQFYGSDRLTADVDLTALTLRGAPEAERRLSFGGVGFKASNGVEVDVIVRDDVWMGLYMAAAANPLLIKVGGGRTLPTVSREYLAIIKIAADREKDIGDVKRLLVMSGFHYETAEQYARDYLGHYGAQELAQLRKIALWEESERQKEIKR